jgi:hypothetical protein
MTSADNWRLGVIPGFGEVASYFTLFLSVAALSVIFRTTSARHAWSSTA